MIVRLVPAVLCLGLVSLPAVAAAPATPAPTTDDDKTLYTIGTILSRSLEGFHLTPKELEIVKAGLSDGVAGTPPKVDAQQYRSKVEAMLMSREKAAGDAYMAKVATQKGATKTPSGIVMTTLTPGTGASPKATDEVKVHYEGKLINGKVFDSSLKRGEPATFPLNGVIPCWTEALQLMKVGGKSRVVCPSSLAYGEQGSPPNIGPNNALIFEVQLLDISKPPAAAPAPPAAAPPKAP
jgi:FKBP-type peptidyl-prolyl cis-trans isomerase FkpA/FKBP-type peptidyl-prolyl cis-trans isomerase FklB